MYQYILYFHIAAGFTALFSGLIPMFTKKGSKSHTNSGWVYFWSMFGVFATSSAMFVFKPERLLFLFLIGIFSFYQTFSGVRAIKRKNPKAKAGRIDWLISGIVLLTSLTMLGMSLATFGDEGMWILYGVFGALCLVHSGQDLKMFYQLQKGKTAPKMHWFFHHIARMGGSYIATFTAFCVVNIQFLPPLVVWILPGLIGGIFLSGVSRRYRHKFKSSVA